MAFPVIKSSPAPVANASGTSIASGNLTVASGDLILVFGHTNSTDETCSDSQGNTYTKQQVADPFGQNCLAIFTALASAASSTLVVTVTQAGTTGTAYNMLAVYIIDGTTIAASFFDVSQIGNDGGANQTSVDTGATANCAGGQELVVAAGFSGTGSVNPTWSAGSGYTLDNSTSVNSGAASIGDEHKTQTGVTTGVDGTFTLSAADVHIAGVAVIKGSVSGAAPAFPPMPQVRGRRPLGSRRRPPQLMTTQPDIAPAPIRRRRLIIPAARSRTGSVVPPTVPNPPFPIVHRRSLVPTAHSRVQMVPVPPPVPPPTPPIPVVRRRSLIARFARRRAEFPWFQAAAPPPPAFIPSGARRLARWLLIYRRGRFVGPALISYQILKKGKSLKPAAIVMTNPTRAPALKPSTIPTLTQRRSASLRPATPPVLTDPREDT